MTQVDTLDRKPRTSSQPFVLTALEALEKRHLLAGAELGVIALFVLIIAVDAHKARTQRLAESAPSSTEVADGKTPTPIDNPIATEMRPRASASADLALSFRPIVPPSLMRAYPTTASGSSATPKPVVAAPAPPTGSDRAPVAAAVSTASAPAESAIATEMQPRASANADLSRSIPSIVPPSLRRAYPDTSAPAGAGPKPVVASVAPQAVPDRPPPPAQVDAAPTVPTVSAAPPRQSPAATLDPSRVPSIVPRGLSGGYVGAAPPTSTPTAPSQAVAPGKPADASAIAPAATAAAPTPKPTPAPSSAPTNGPAAFGALKMPDAAPAAASPPAAPLKEARLRPEDEAKTIVPDKLREQKDFEEAFLSASRMLERRLTPEEREASIEPDYIDAMQRIEGFYDPTRVGPFGIGMRWEIRPGTMSMTDVFGERWTRANADPNVHYRVGYHAETWLRPRSHKCEDFWRFRPISSPVALDKLTPTDCARIRAKPQNETALMAESGIVAAPLTVPVFAAPYPGSRMTHDELMAALRARADAAREELWYGHSPGLVRPLKAFSAPALAPPDETPAKTATGPAGRPPADRKRTDETPADRPSTD